MTQEKRDVPAGTRRLLRTGGQIGLFDTPSVEEEVEQQDRAEASPAKAGQNQPASVECLGITFASEDDRRACFIERLREKLADPAFRAQPGFPLGDDEDILRLSDPPYYTACPNPFLEDFVKAYGRPYDPAEPYLVTPLAADVTEGKSDPLYQAHTYHTKVPHRAIMRYILHYTRPGDLVLDPFAGSGMTGVAATLCGNHDAVESLGYSLLSNDSAPGAASERTIEVGRRFAVLNDLSPAATFISHNYTTPVDVQAFAEAAHRTLASFTNEYGWMYETLHTDGVSKARINYTIWSDVFVCPHCQADLVFWDVAVEDGAVQDQFPCSTCLALVSRGTLERVHTAGTNRLTGDSVTTVRRVPVRINYTVDGKRFEKVPSAEDFRVLARIETEPVPGWFPITRIDRDLDLWYERDYRALGIASVPDFYLKRSLIMSAYFYRHITQLNDRIGSFCWFWFQSVLMGFTLLNRYLRNAFSQVNRTLSGTLYVGALSSEVSPYYALEGKIRRLRIFESIDAPVTVVSTGSASCLGLPDRSVDYIFTDPPFGSNIIYSDLSLIWESWIRMFTNTADEAVIHRRKRDSASTLDSYTQRMTASFVEMFRVLKPGRWITVEFHNTRSSVWIAIQQALMSAGFVIADVRTLDKKLDTFKQVTAAGAVKQDLVDGHSRIAA